MRKFLTTKVGEKIVFDGEFVHGIEFRIRSSPQRAHIDIYTSGLNPKMMQLAGEVSDGIVLSHMPIEAIDEVKRNIEIGAKKTGRDPKGVKILSIRLSHSTMRNPSTQLER